MRSWFTNEEDMISSLKPLKRWASWFWQACEDHQWLPALCAGVLFIFANLGW